MDRGGERKRRNTEIINGKGEKKEVKKIWNETGRKK